MHLTGFSIIVNGTILKLTSDYFDNFSMFTNIYSVPLLNITCLPGRYTYFEMDDIYFWLRIEPNETNRENQPTGLYFTISLTHFHFSNSKRTNPDLFRNRSNFHNWRHLAPNKTEVKKKPSDWTAFLHLYLLKFLQIIFNFHSQNYTIPEVYV